MNHYNHLPTSLIVGGTAADKVKQLWPQTPDTIIQAIGDDLFTLRELCYEFWVEVLVTEDGVSRPLRRELEFAVKIHNPQTVPHFREGAPKLGILRLIVAYLHQGEWVAQGAVKFQLPPTNLRELRPCEQKQISDTLLELACRSGMTLESIDAYLARGDVPALVHEIAKRSLQQA